MSPTKPNPSSSLDRPTLPEDDVVSDRSSFESARTHQSVSSRGTRADDEAESSGDDRPKNPAPAASSSAAPNADLRKVSSKRNFQPFTPAVQSPDDSSDTETEMGRAPGTGIPLRSRPRMGAAEAAARAADRAHPGVAGSSALRLEEIGLDLPSEDEIRELVTARLPPRSDAEPASDEERDLPHNRQALAGAYQAFTRARDSAPGPVRPASDPLAILQLAPPQEIEVMQRTTLAQAVRTGVVQVLKGTFAQTVNLTTTLLVANLAAKSWSPSLNERDKAFKEAITSVANGGVAVQMIASSLFDRLSSDTSLPPSARSDIGKAALVLTLGVSYFAAHYTGARDVVAVQATRLAMVQLMRALTSLCFQKATNRNKNDTPGKTRLVAKGTAIGVLVAGAGLTSLQRGAYGGASLPALTASLSEAILPLAENALLYGALVEGAFYLVNESIDSALSKFAPGEEPTTRERVLRETGIDSGPSALDNMRETRVSFEPPERNLTKIFEHLANDSAPNMAVALTIANMTGPIAALSKTLSADPDTQSRIQTIAFSLIVGLVVPAILLSGDRSQPYAEGSVLGKTVARSPRAAQERDDAATRQTEIDAGAPRP